MGVPKFYRWLSERYPKINQVITDNALLPEFDHLYLDMNGIIHGCTHPSHLDISERLSEKEMILGIMNYVDRIITQIVKPKVSVFLAVDGVAPRAKLNQQRSRRFRSAKDMAEATKKKDVHSKVGGGDETALFDSNCITPGTEFMTKISNAIQYFIRKKIKEDPQWRHLKIIYSGPEVPGEGEHKIMDHIRDMRSQPNYQPNTRHCMYGQDADLIMLALITHEPHFTLLREIIDFSAGFERNENALKAVTKFSKKSDFLLLHLSILREYLAIEFDVKSDTSYDLERIIDDFIFLTFLVGNDFLPHMACLDIGYGAFDLLFTTYKEQRLNWGNGDYLTWDGEIQDMTRLELFFAVIGATEDETFEKKEDTEMKFIRNKRKWDKRNGKTQEGPSEEDLVALEECKQINYMSMINNLLQEYGPNGKYVDGWLLPTVEKKDYKGRYYFEKLGFTPVDREKHLALRTAYVEGLIWCLAYYYKGCISWSWFFPFHYAPMLSDLVKLDEIANNIRLEKGSPLKPFEQLMGCLPPASASLVPRSYRKLMCSPDSPIIQFYPLTFEIDMNGKKNAWEGVNILPFIDVHLLKDTISKLCPDDLLTPEERSRNITGHVYLYSFDAAVNDVVPSCNRDIGLLDIPRCNSRVDVFDSWKKRNLTPIKSALIPGTKIPYPGFPSLNVLPMTSSELIGVGVNCFGIPSKYETMVLSLQRAPKLPDAKELATLILGKNVFINWPLMHEAKVVAISDYTCTVRLLKKQLIVHTFNTDEMEEWQNDSNNIIQQYLKGAGIPGSGGVDIGDIQIRLKMVPLQGMRTNNLDGSKKKVFGTEEADVPLQMVLWKTPAPDLRFEERGPLTLKDRFPEHARVIITRGKYRGCLGTVLGVTDDDKVGVELTVTPPEPPFGLAIARSIQESFLTSIDVAKLLKLHPAILMKVTGSLFFNPGKYDLGLNLVYKRDFYVLGYSRRRKVVGHQSNDGISRGSSQAWKAGDSVLVVGNKRHCSTVANEQKSHEKYVWEYTPKTVRLIMIYMQRFPLLFSAVTKYPNQHVYDSKILGTDGTKILATIREWLNDVETAKIPRTPCTTEAMPHAAVKAVQHAADVRVSTQQAGGPLATINLKVPSSALYREGSTTVIDVLHASDNQNTNPELGIRIANLCSNGVPFGARGTVVGIHDSLSGCVEVVMDQEFLGGSTLQGYCGNFRGKLCVWNHLLTISPSDSKDAVNNIIPSGSIKAVIESSLERTVHSADDETIKDSDYRDKTDMEKIVTASDRNEVHSKSTYRSRVEDGSFQSASKQGTWKEAKGPDESKIGFNSTAAHTGLESWRRHLSSQETGLHAFDKCSKPSINGVARLKAMLGVNVGKSSTEELKAILKLGVDSAVTIKALQPKDATAELKNILGVAVPENTPSSSHLYPPPKTAADVFLQVMASTQQPSATAHPIMASPPRPIFNFSYVKEGEASQPKISVAMNGMQPHFPQVPNPYLSPVHPR